MKNQNRPIKRYLSPCFIFLSTSILITTFLYLLDIRRTPLSLLLTTTLSTPTATNTNRVLFYEHDSYQNLSHHSDDLWNALLPPNGGFLKKFDGDGKPHKYGLTMYHSLHCLIMMRSAIQGLYGEIDRLSNMNMHPPVMGSGSGEVENRRKKNRNTNMNVSSDEEHSGHGDANGSGDSMHWLHCFDYLRQTILCAADGTLEPPLVDSHGKEKNIDGMIERECRDPGELWNLSVLSYNANATMAG